MDIENIFIIFSNIARLNQFFIEASSLPCTPGSPLHIKPVHDLAIEIMSLHLVPV
jgi:hypothetical protein